MQLFGMIKRLVSPPGRVAFTNSRVVVERFDGSVAFALAGWQGDVVGHAFQPGHVWDAVASGGRNRRLSHSRGISALKERSRLSRWTGCVRDGARLQPLDGTCAVELRDVLPDLGSPGRIRGDSAGLRQVWLREAPDRCEECGTPCDLVIVSGVDADYVAWSCEQRGDTVSRVQLCTALALRYGIPVEFD